VRAERAGPWRPAIAELRAAHAALGGVSLVYRKGMLDSPAYRLNHEEITKSLEEGIAFVERMNPEEAIPDAFGHVAAVRFREQINEHGKWRDGDAVVTMPARSVFVAAGTTPNVTYEREYPGTFQMDERRRFFKPHVADRAGDGSLTLVPASEGFFTSYNRDGRHVTYYGDNHPRYAGNVVKAMASGARRLPARGAAVPGGRKRGDGQRDRGAPRRNGSGSRPSSTTTSSPRVERVDPADADHRRVDCESAGGRPAFPAGQFYRLQNSKRRRPCWGPARTARACSWRAWR